MPARPITSEDALLMIAFGYRPRVTPGPITRLNDAVEEAPTPVSFDSCVAEGRRIMAAVMDAECAAAEGPHVVLLSGGIDSRFLLGHLVSRFGTREVSTISFGVPGALDYDIARRIARAVGVRHSGFDLAREADWGLDALLAEAGRSDGVVPVVTQSLFRQFLEANAAGSTYWSGYLGGEVAGSHIGWREGADTWSSAVRRFADIETKGRLRALVPGWEDAWHSVAPERPLVAGPVHYMDQLDFAVRQESLIRPGVTMDGFDFRTPFERSEWGGYMLAQPDGMKLGKRLYKAIVESSFPALARLPHKESAGAPMNTSVRRHYVHRARLRLLSEIGERGGPKRWRAIHRYTNKVPLHERYELDPTFRSAVDELCATDWEPQLDFLEGVLVAGDELPTVDRANLRLRVASIGAAARTTTTTRG